MPDKLPIDLSHSMSEPCCSPMKMDEPHYPSLHLEWSEDYKLPESGELTVKFRKVSETNSKHGGKRRQSVTLDIISIEEVKKGKVTTESDDEDYDKEDEESSGDRLDKMAEEAEDEEGED